MDTKQFLNDEELIEVTGGDKTSMGKLSQTVNLVVMQLEAIAASAPAADQALLRGYIATLNSTCSSGDAEAVRIAVLNMRDSVRNVPLQDESIRGRAYNVLFAAYYGFISF